MTKVVSTFLLHVSAHGGQKSTLGVFDNLSLEKESLAELELAGLA